ncbi:MAG TPA: GreA/GreB family elongation factor [Actinomycetota bacterium]|nr:GreA/GreB family elongation factor [Actinomycetota bacterium]
MPSAVRKKLEQRLDELEQESIPVLEVELSTTPGLDAAALLTAARRERERILDAFQEAEDAPAEWNPRYIEVGDTVTINEIGTRTVERYTIVPIEARSALDEGWISWASPLGSSLLGRAPGDVVDVRTPGGLHRYRILNFEEA